MWGTVALAAAALLLAARLLAPNLLLAAASPAFALGTGVSARVSALFASAGSARSFAAKNTALASANATLELENATLAAKVADLETLIGTSTPPLRGIAAGVVARPPEAPYDTLIVDGGADAGVLLRMEAAGPAGTPLGLVTGVTARFARVRLFTAAGALTDAWVGTARVPILLKGAGGSFVATVPQGSGVAVGDLVYLGGAGAVPVGRVARLSGDASEPVVTLAIAPLVNPLSLAVVSLVETPAAASSTLESGL
ncbi:MAG: hypothetical protein KGI78_03540 [Patescibacteria group bacterium]|nr:hypothetical protein [Patescibacteria group bacterium]MDE1944019.1 hypothetical protein [Patescibacteria group bacterium]MDE2057900.1 hypothetical protein [Patescibacteria group bacterium]